MPGKWKVGTVGASAQQKADRLRTKADKLGRQATAWETGAEREPAVGRRLADLPSGFTVLNDLRIPGTDARLDHLVISAGGLYLVDAKKYSGHLIYSKKMLWHGRFPIVDKLETLAWEAETLGELLGREVVPVMCFVDAVLPQPVATLGSVIVCRTSVLHTVVRSTHATMSAAEVSHVIDVGGRLAAPRGAGVELFGLVPPVARTPDATAELDAPFDVDALSGVTPAGSELEPTGDDFWTGATTKPPAGRSTSPIPVVVAGSPPAISTIPTIAGADDLDGPSKRQVDRRWPRRLGFGLLAAALAGLTVVIVWKVSSTSESNRIEAERELSSTTTTTAGTTLGSEAAAEAVTTTTVLDITAAAFSATCPSPGSGWALRPVWPGNLDNLAWYDFAFQQFDASFTSFALMTGPDVVPEYTPTAVPPGNARTIRIRAVYADGTIGDPVDTVWTAPDAPC